MVIKLSNEFKFYVNYSIQEAQNISEILSEYKERKYSSFCFFPRKRWLTYKNN